jgi:hypothetical protein
MTQRTAERVPTGPPDGPGARSAPVPSRGGGTAAAGHELHAVAARHGIPPQREIELGRTDDPQERDADRVAAQALRAAPPDAPPRGPGAAPGPAQGIAPPIVHAALGSPGVPLEGTARAFFARRLGADLSGVRVHRDSTAAASARAVGAVAYAVGADIVFAAGRYAPATSGGRRLLAHELAHVLQRRTAGAGAASRLARQDANALAEPDAADALIDAYSGLLTVDTAALGAELRRRVVLGERDLLEAVLDGLSFLNRHWVAVAFAGPGSEEDLEWLGQTPEGRALLDVVLDGATRNWVGEAETAASERISAALIASRPQAAVEQEIFNTMVFPFKLPGLTVVSDAAIFAEQRPGGRIWVRQEARVYYQGAYPDEVATLPPEVFGEGLVIPDNQVVGIRMYDLGGQVIHRPAAFLLRLGNETDATIIGNMVTTAGLALGGVGAVEAGAGLGAHVLLWADRVALAAQVITTVAREHRGWIITRFGPDGETILRYVDMVNSVVALYGGARALVGMTQLMFGFGRAIANWRASAALLDDQLTAAERVVVRQVTDESTAVVSEVDELARAEGAAGDVVPDPSAAEPLPPARPEPPAATAEAPPALQPAEAEAAAVLEGASDCFAAGTEVLTPDGPVRIEALRVGDRVLALDPVTGIASTADVTNAYARDVPGVLAIAVGRVTISVTREHPFWVQDSGWRRAGELTAGTTLRCESGRAVAVRAIARRDGPTTVHNLTVAGVSTYFVSAARVLVHNKSAPRTTPLPTPADLPAAKATAIQASLDAEAKAEAMIEAANKALDKAAESAGWRLRNELRANRDSIAEAVTPDEFRNYDGWREEWTRELEAITVLRKLGEGLPSDAKWGNLKSLKAYGHTVRDHGADRLPSLFLEDAKRYRAARGYEVPQGQFYDDATIVLAERLAPLRPGAHDMDLSRPIGRVYFSDGRVLEYVTTLRIVRNPDLTVLTAFPIP